MDIDSIAKSLLYHIIEAQKPRAKMQEEDARASSDDNLCLTPEEARSSSTEKNTPVKLANNTKIYLGGIAMKSFPAQ